MKPNKIIKINYDGKFVKRMLLISSLNDDKINNRFGLRVFIESLIDYPLVNGVINANNGHIKDEYNIIFNNIDELATFQIELEKGIIPPQLFDHTIESDYITYKYVITKKSVYVVNSETNKNKIFVTSGYTEIKRITNSLLKWCKSKMNELMNKNDEVNESVTKENSNQPQERNTVDTCPPYQMNNPENLIYKYEDNEQQQMHYPNHDYLDTKSINIENNRILTFIHYQTYSLIINNELLTGTVSTMAGYMPVTNTNNSMSISTIFINHDKCFINMLKATLLTVLSGRDVGLYIGNTQNEIHLAEREIKLQINRDFIQQGTQAFKLSKECILAIISVLDDLIKSK